MFILLPYGVEEATVDRVPWISVAIAATCLLAFAVTWVAPANPTGTDPAGLEEAFDYWSEHPYLELPERLQETIKPEVLALLDQMRSKSDVPPPAPHLVASEQYRLEGMVDAYFAAADRSLLRRFSLVPDRGVLQLGWLTHMFLHFGWMHLLANLLFFYVVGPLLEDIWGRVFFAGFYLVGGLVSGIAQAALTWGTPVMNLGASGAIAACMGAFAFRYATRQVRMAYFLWIVFAIFRGTFKIPAWLWGLFWFGAEVWSYWRGSYDGIAVMAHIGGFGFGVAAAFAMRTSGFEARFIAPAVEKKVAWTQHPGVTAAFEALERGDLAAARAGYDLTLAEDPGNQEALLGLGRLQLEAGEGAAGMVHIEKALGALIPTPEKLWAALADLNDKVDLKALRPQLAWRLAVALDTAADARELVERLNVAAAKADGLLGTKAAIRCLELRVELGHPQIRIDEALQAVRARQPLPEELQRRVSAVQARIGSTKAPGSAERDGEATRRATPAGAGAGNEPVAANLSQPSPRPRVVAGRFLALGDASVTIESADGKRGELPYARILALAVGVVPGPAEAGRPARGVLHADLVLSWGAEGAGPTVLRVTSRTVDATQLAPGMPPQQAWLQVLTRLLESSGAHALPDRESLGAGRYPRFASLEAFEQSFYASP